MREEITPPFSDLIELLISGSRVSPVSGMWGSSRAFFLSCLASKTERPVVVITPTDEAAESLITDLRLFSSWFIDPPILFSIPFWEILPYDTIPPHPDIIHERMSAYRALLSDNKGIYVIPVHSVMQRPMSGKEVKEAVIVLKTGENIDRDTLLSQLVRSGYEPSDLVTNRGLSVFAAVL